MSSSRRRIQFLTGRQSAPASLRPWAMTPLRVLLAILAAPIACFSSPVQIDLVWEFDGKSLTVTHSAFDPEILGEFPLGFVAVEKLIINSGDRRDLSWERTLLSLDQSGLIGDEYTDVPLGVLPFTGAQVILVVDGLETENLGRISDSVVRFVTLPRPIEFSVDQHLIADETASVLALTSPAGWTRVLMGDGPEHVTVPYRVSRILYDRTTSMIALAGFDNEDRWRLSIRNHGGESVYETGWRSGSSSPIDLRMIPGQPIVAVAQRRGECPNILLVDGRTGVEENLAIRAEALEFSERGHVMAVFDICRSEPGRHASELSAYEMSSPSAPRQIWSRIEEEAVDFVLPIDERGTALVRFKDRIEIVSEDGTSRVLFEDATRPSRGQVLHRLQSSYVIEGSVGRSLPGLPGLRLYHIVWSEGN